MISSASLFRLASQFDVTLPGHLSARAQRLVDAKRLLPKHYSREILLDRLASGKVALFSDFPTGPTGSRAPETLCRVICRSIGGSERANVQIGQRRSRRTMPLSEVMRRWLKGRHLTSTTDLHFRGTSLVGRFRAASLSDFNLLGPPSPDWLEMMTLVVSTAGSVSESHSDDCDGSNHCITGAKLWLVWDRLEGKAAGLQDVTHDDVYGAERFEVSTFLALKSSRWFVVNPGVTLFLPGHLTHRVITLEPYVGFGSFNITLASWPRTLGRWETTGAAYVTTEMRRHLVSRVMRRAVAIRSNPAQRETFGWERARAAVRAADRALPARVRRASEYRAFAALFT